MSNMFGTVQKVLDWPEVNLDFIRVGHWTVVTVRAPL